MSSLVIEENIRKTLQLGLNLHVSNKFDYIQQQAEIEKLYQQINTRRNDILITNEEKLKCELKRFGLSKQRTYSPNNISKDQISDIKNIKNNKDIVIRKADKSNTFVIMNKTEYNLKLNNIVSNEDKFQPALEEDVDIIKKEANKLISEINKKSNKLIFKPIQGSFKPGYIYGSPKIHKNAKDPPLRPIISTIPSPTYELSKELNNIIKLYIPKTYSINSTKEFIAILTGHNNKIPSEKLLASLDVQSLFTNVPLDEAIDITLNYIYENKSIPPPDIDKEKLRNLLKLCTSKCPFTTPDGKKIYVQKDGVMMGCVLGPTLADIYMDYKEKQILNICKNKPSIYCRYVDDIFVVIDNLEQLEEIRLIFEENTVLKFTYEVEKNKQLNFLDCNIIRHGDNIKTNTHIKDTFDGNYLHFNSICPIRYKTGIIKTLLHRAKLICSTWQYFHQETTRLKQILVNNGYPLSMIDKEIKNFLNVYYNKKENQQNDTKSINLYFRNQMTNNYKQRENQLRKIINNNIKEKTINSKINLQIYYKNMKLKDLVLSPKTKSSATEETSNVVYQYTCPHSGCKATESTYIGYTTNTVKVRMQQHYTSGAIRKHYEEEHKIRPTKENILENTKIIRKGKNKEDLMLMEALYIKNYRPIINRKDEGLVKTLKIFQNSN